MIISAVAALGMLAGALLVGLNIDELAKISESFTKLGVILSVGTLASTAVYCATDLSLSKRN